MVFVWYALNVLFMIAIPVMVARFIHTRRRSSWGLFVIGAATFILSQVGHIPFNYLILQRWQLVPVNTAVPGSLALLALFLGLSSGVFEEMARYLTYRFWAKDARSWGAGLMLGAGHGGIESILVGLLVVINVGVLSTIREGALWSAIPTEVMPAVQAQIEAVFSAPWYLILMGALERIFALTVHLALSLLVLQTFIRKQKRWVWLAILGHSLLNATAVFAAVTWNVYITELLIGLFAVMGAGIIFFLRQPEPAELPPEPLPAAGLVVDRKHEITAEALERSRYS